MHELFALVVSFPVIVPTAVLAVALVYWVFVLAGALEVHHGAEGIGGHDGGLEGAHHAAGHGHDGAGHGDGADEATGLSALFSALHFDRAPATVVISVLAAFTWVFSVIEARMVGAERLGGTPLGVLFGALVLIVALALSLLPASVVVRPLGRIFVTHPAQGRAELVGQVCLVVSGRVDEKFGQARLEDGGAGLLIPIRVSAGVKLTKGQRALIVRWSEQPDEYLVEPLDAILEDSKKA